MANYSYKKGVKYSLKIEGADELREQVKKIGKVPKKILTKSAKAGVDKPFAEAKRKLKKGKTGLLKKGFKKTMEKAKRRTKSVYRVMWDKQYAVEGKYLKKTTGVYGGKTPHAYYPFSYEYGFKTKYGRKKGQYIVRDTFEKHEKQSLDNIMDVLWKYIDTVK
jgi:hypothetical protein